MSHIYLDIETLDLATTGVITQIAAVEFDPATFEIGRTLDLALCADDQVMRGRTIDDDTILWHASKGNTIVMSAGLSLPDAFDRFNAWMESVKPERVWIWGPDFDRPVLEHAAVMLKRKLPWEYFNTMDGRTIWSLAFPTTKRPHRPPAGLGDCLASINDLHTSLVKLNFVEPCYV